MSTESHDEILRREKSVSRTSRTSIKVKLPSASSSQRELSPEYNSSPDVVGKHMFPSPDGRYYNDLKSQNAIRHDITLTSHSMSPLSSPAQSLRHGLQNQRELFRQAAASVIERAWISHRNRQMFCLIKHSLCAAETTLSHEVLRKVAPKEAEFFRDKSLPIKVRFRFGGVDFPPMIYFKVFYNSDITGVKYISGKKMIKPASEAAEDSLRLMGNRLFYEQLLQDVAFRQRYNITDEIDVTTLKDYMQYLSHLDETPASMGGKMNYWRKLTLGDLPRHTIFYDVVDYAYNRVMTPRLQGEMTILTMPPVTQDILLAQLEIISKHRSIVVSLPTTPSKYSKLLDENFNAQTSSRRSKQARRRAIKMRKMMGLDRDESNENVDSNPLSTDPDDWEQEASKLYEWTQELSFNDDVMSTPKLLYT